MLKRFFSVIVAGILIALYVITLILGLMQDERTTDLLMASVAATILVPVTLYAYQQIFRLIKRKDEKNDD